jgi:LytS/YehU family sensor histidine kinase
MRYIIKESKNDKIALQNELDYISNYIALQEARLSNTVQIHYVTTGEPDTLEIAPLILITYIENAFKYGINPDKDNARVDVKIVISNSGLSMQVFNYKMPLVKNMESTGMGIENTAQRLQLLYPNKHQLTIQENAESYSVSLTLELK